MGRLERKVAIVTGGGRGLGRAIALALASEGAHVTVTGRTKSDLEEVVQRIEKSGGDAGAVATNIIDESGVNALVDGVVTRFGRIDILVNNAGTILRKPTLESTTAEWRQVIDVNVTGTYLCAVAAGRHMVLARSGRIINIASVVGGGGRAGMAAYCASKAAVMNLTRALAVEWAPLGVYVNGIAPGQFDTEMGAPILSNPVLRDALLAKIPLGRVGQPHEIGPLVVFLASDDCTMITGEIIFIDAGLNAV
jgi:NAD(P)-dependent dehydrogenase (short-subunit alcohol dehydrogenase family)